VSDRTRSARGARVRSHTIPPVARRRTERKASTDIVLRSARLGEEIRAPDCLSVTPSKSTSAHGRATERRIAMLRLTRTHAAALVTLTTIAAACGGSETGQPGTVVSHEPLVVATVETASEPTSKFVVDPNVTFEQAESTFQSGGYAEATEMFAVYTARKPENPWGHYMLGLSSWKSGQLDRARKAFESALELDSSHVKSYVNLARVLLDEGRKDEALVRIRQAVALDTTSGDAWRVLGRVHGELGNVEDAVSAYQTALAIDPDDRWAMNNMGLVLIRAGRYDEALLPLARAVQIDESNTPQFLNNLGIALERTGRYAQAEQQYRKALESDGGYAKATVSLARVTGRSDDPGVSAVEVHELGDSFAIAVAQWRADRGLTPVAEQPAIVPDSVKDARQVSKADSTSTPR
jgi:Tfp pilus assembly protein PilF